MLHPQNPKTTNPYLPNHKGACSPLNWKVLVKWLRTARWWSSFSPSMSPMKACKALCAVKHLHSLFGQPTPRLQQQAAEAHQLLQAQQQPVLILPHAQAGPDTVRSAGMRHGQTARCPNKLPVPVTPLLMQLTA